MDAGNGLNNNDINNPNPIHGNIRYYSGQIRPELEVVRLRRGLYRIMEKIKKTVDKILYLRAKRRGYGK